LAIDFLMLGDFDAALVETRRLNEKLEHYKVDSKKNYEQNVFAIYLSALIWEHNRDWDDAYIAYEHAYKLSPNIEYLKKDLIRAAINARRYEQAKKWEKKFGIRRKKSWQNPKMAEVVLIYQQGWGPRKQPNPKWRRIPKLFPVDSYTQGAVLEVVGRGKENAQPIYSVQDVSIKTLDDQYAPLVAKRIAAVAAKEVISDQVRQKNEALGAILNIAMHVADRADLRQWSTLPESFQIAKLRLKPGKYRVRIKGVDGSGNPTGELSEELELVAKAGKKTFFNWRSFR